jgi:hypothetical protein
MANILPVKPPGFLSKLGTTLKNDWHNVVLHVGSWAMLGQVSGVWSWIAKHL